MERKLIVLGVLCELLLVSVGGWLLVSPGPTAEAACRGAMQRVAGYGPWQQQDKQPATRPDRQVILFWDGYTTHSCQARAVGSFWIVEPHVDATMADCSVRPGGPECPRA